MSISITGLRFHSRSLGEVVAALQVLRPQMRAESRRRRMLFLATRAVEIIDRTALGRSQVEDLDPVRPLRSAAQDLDRRQQQIRAEGRRDPEVDHSFDVVLLPHAGRIYGAIFTDNPNGIDILRDQPFLEDYSWWNGSDGPDAVDAAAWTERGRVWNEIIAIDPGGRLAGAGVTFAFLPWEGAVTADELVHFAQEPAARAWKLARETVLAERARALEHPPTMGDMMREIRALDLPENRVLVAAAAEDIARRLPEITPELLRGRRAQG